MRLHSNNITLTNLNVAAQWVQKIHDIKVDMEVVAKRSRKRERGYEVKLTTTTKKAGVKRSRPRTTEAALGCDWALTLDEWGSFLARLYMEDKEMIAGEYTSEVQFHDVTGGGYLLELAALL